jgi:putative transposase
MVSPTKRRDAVAVLQGSYRITTRRACHLVGQPRSTHYKRITGKRDATALRARMKELAAARPRYGYRRIHTLLRREGWKDGIDRVYRLYRLDGLSVRSKPRKKRRAVVRVPPASATAPRQRWAIDFVHDMLADGRPFRVLSVVDVFSRSSEILEPGVGFTGARVARAARSRRKGELP